MALERDAYRELEDVLGTENISEDLAVLEGYAFQPHGATFLGRYFRVPDAVVLPGSTKEVQSIIKVCNRRGIQSKAFCTGYGVFCAISRENSIIIDLRRMNRILDIDEKNMMVLVEPYVSFAQVQAEAMKRGLGCHVIGAGSQTSFLASHTSMHGNNILAISHGYSGRNLFGVEWVLPTGEIVNVGAPGSGAGWFSGDGPGPSIRGILRGALGAQGGLGVFTKCAGHLHPWYGPTEWEIKGRSPYYETEVPENFTYHLCEFPSWEKYGEALYRVGESGIAYAQHKSGGPGTHGACVCGSNDEYYEKHEKGEYIIPRKSFSIVMAGSSPEEHAYQKKVLDRILEETSGKIVPMGEDPEWQRRDYLTMIKACFIPRMAFRLTGTFGVDGMVGNDTVDASALGLAADEKHRDKWVKTGILMDDGVLNSWGVGFEGSHFALFECGHQFSSINKESLAGWPKMIKEGRQLCYDTPFSLSWAISGKDELTWFGPVCCNFPRWMARVKSAFDPNMVSDPSMYSPGVEDAWS